MDTNEMYEAVLAHHGIKGMKWGRRRFQNPDGSLTPAGKKRYDDDNLDTSDNTSVESSKQSRREARQLKKEQRRTFKDDVKNARKNKGMEADYDKETGDILQFYDSRGNKVGSDYVDKVFKTAKRQQTVRSLVGSAVFTAGMAYVVAKYT